MGLYNIVLQDEAFYAGIQENSTVIVDKDQKTVQIQGVNKVFGYQHSDIEETLLEAGGILPLYSRYGRAVFRQMTAAKSQQPANSNRADVVDAPTFQRRTRQTKTGLDW